jgi:protoheme IX farnesyltransferase
MSTVEAASGSGAASVLRDYLSLTKPRIVALLVATAVGAMIPAAHGWPHPLKVLAVALGGSLAAGGASAINCWFDRDIDAAMRRTRRRPLPDGRIPAAHALVLGIGLNVAAFVVLVAWANLLAAALSALGTLIYVFVYTIWLKRSTPQNIVIGGAAGAIPPLVGWAAVTGRLDLTAISLFLVILFWTPPHFWALAQLIDDDYRRARIPMMPSVAGVLTTKRQSLVYSLVLVVVSLVPFFTGAVGAVYLAGAGLLGAGFIAMAVLDLGGRRWTRKFFGYSIAYLAALFTLLVVGTFTV